MLAQKLALFAAIFETAIWACCFRIFDNTTADAACDFGICDHLWTFVAVTIVGQRLPCASLPLGQIPWCDSYPWARFYGVKITPWTRFHLTLEAAIFEIEIEDAVLTFAAMDAAYSFGICGHFCDRNCGCGFGICDHFLRTKRFRHLRRFLRPK